MAKDNALNDFERSMAELETIVLRMEQDSLSLSDSLQAFERGVKLGQHCQQLLQEAEQKVQVLLDSSDQPSEDESLA